LENYAENEKKYETEPLVRPDYWGGWKVNPSKIEFW
jgi:pyridoxine/pyridoxamine 5'-phosphate oxidase